MLTQIDYGIIAVYKHRQTVLSSSLLEKSIKSSLIDLLPLFKYGSKFSHHMVLPP